jgi:hypothetical protein
MYKMGRCPSCTSPPTQLSMIACSIAPGWHSTNMVIRCSVLVHLAFNLHFTLSDTHSIFILVCICKWAMGSGLHSLFAVWYKSCLVLPSPLGLSHIHHIDIAHLSDAYCIYHLGLQEKWAFGSLVHIHFCITFHNSQRLIFLQLQSYITHMNLSGFTSRFAPISKVGISNTRKPHNCFTATLYHIMCKICEDAHPALHLPLNYWWLLVAWLLCDILLIWQSDAVCWFI